jgi:spermidine/putrescine transport system substrate-binding protein
MSKSRPPLSPEARALVRAQLSRRSMLAGAGATALGLGAVSACGTGSSSAPEIKAAADKSDAEKVVNFANWEQYMDVDDATKGFPTLEAFEKKSGIKVTYAEDIDDNDSYYGKISGQLKNGQDIGKDIVVFTDWMAGRMISKGYTQAFDDAQMTNKKNIVAAYKDVDYDRGRKNSIPWQAGFAGVAWSKAKVPNGIKSLDDLWKPELKGRVEVLTEMRDTMGLILLAQGVDISKPFTTDQYMNGIDFLQKQFDSGQIRQAKGGGYTEDLKSGDALAVIGWSGDITSLNAENGDRWSFGFPESGATLWADNAMIPIGSPHKKNAEAVLNYYYDPVVAATLAAWVNYICPVEGARAAMEKIDPELVDNPYIFPDDAFLAKTKAFRTLSPTEEKTFSEAFQKALGN